MNIKQRVKINIWQIKIDVFSNFAGINRLYISVYSNQHENSKRRKTKRHYLPEGIIDDSGLWQKNYWDQPVDSDIKPYEEIRKLTTRQGEDYTTGCSLDYDYIKNHYILIIFDLRRQKELDVHPKAIQQIELVG